MIDPGPIFVSPIVMSLSGRLSLALVALKQRYGHLSAGAGSVSSFSLALAFEGRPKNGLVATAAAAEPEASHAENNISLPAGRHYETKRTRAVYAL